MKWSRRRFLMAASATTAGLASGLAGGVIGAKRQFSDDVSRPAPSAMPTNWAMPGPFAGRVIEVVRPGSVRPDWSIAENAVRPMMDQGVCRLTGADHPTEAWKTLFELGDVVGIKVNPVGLSNRRGTVSAISKPEIVVEIVRNLKSIGIPGRDIIIFDRYAQEFVASGYERLLREPALDGCRWYASAAHYTDQQVAIDGLDLGPDAYTAEMQRHVVGYDPDTFVHLDYCSPAHHPKDDRRFRSHLSLVVTTMVNKIITIPVLKDHRSSGVTLSLKNMSHGFNNNVARSHIAGVGLGVGASTVQSVFGPNQCNTLIPSAVNQRLIREKATLHILDGLIGVYEGGPGPWNRSWSVWPCEALFFATDPVALDHVGWTVIDAQRLKAGWARAGAMGRDRYSAVESVRLGFAPLAAAHPLQSIAAAAAAEDRRRGGESELFDRRQPEHIYLAATAGLGTFERDQIDLQRVRAA